MVINFAAESGGLYTTLRLNTLYSRALARICEKYYWTKHSESVHHYTRSCQKFQQRQKNTDETGRTYSAYCAASAPSQQIGIDLIGWFPTIDPSKSRWIIVATAYLTRYGETKALPLDTACWSDKLCLTRSATSLPVAMCFRPRYGATRIVDAGDIAW